jgi:hypothetical protein
MLFINLNNALFEIVALDVAGPTIHDSFIRLLRALSGLFLCLDLFIVNESISQKDDAFESRSWLIRTNSLEPRETAGFKWIRPWK